MVYNWQKGLASPPYEKFRSIDGRYWSFPPEHPRYTGGHPFAFMDGHVKMVPFDASYLSPRTTCGQPPSNENLSTNGLALGHFASRHLGCRLRVDKRRPSTTGSKGIADQSTAPSRGIAWDREYRRTRKQPGSWFRSASIGCSILRLLLISRARLRGAFSPRDPGTDLGEPCPIAPTSRACRRRCSSLRRCAGRT